MESEDAPAKGKKGKESYHYEGFYKPESNFFILPNSWTNITHNMTTLAEMKVVEYVLRHTWGFQEYGITKRITLDEFMNGRKKIDGTRMDLGTGLGKKAVIDGLRLAINHGFLIEETDESDKARIKKYYALRMAGQGFLDRTPDVRSSNPNDESEVRTSNNRGIKIEQRTEKETLERNHTIKIEEKERNDQKGTPDPSTLWSSVLASLEKQMTQANFQTWLAGTEAVKLDAQAITVRCGTEFKRDWLQQRMAGHVRRELADVAERQLEVRFTC